MMLLKTAKGGPLVLAVGAFALAVVIAFWTAAVTISSNDRDRTLAAVDLQNTNLVRTLAEHAGRTLDYVDRIALQIKFQHEQLPGAFDLQKFGRDSGINRRIVPGIAIADAGGNVLQMDIPLKRPVNISDREHFKAHAAADSGKPYISRPLEARAAGVPKIIVLSRRLNRKDGSFDGIVSVAIDPDSFTGFYRELGLGEKGLVVLTGLDGFVRARNVAGNEGIGQDVRKGALFREYSQHESGVMRYAAVTDGVMRRAAYRRLDGYPLAISIGVAEADILAEVGSRTRALYLGAAMASLLAMLSAAALIVMVHRRERDAAAVREGEERFRRLVEDSPDATFVNRGETVLYANAALLRLLGAERAEQIVGGSVFAFLHPDFHEVVRTRIEAMRQNPRNSAAEIFERRFVRLDGTVIDVETTGVNVQLPDGQARHLVARDITARKRNEAALRESMERYRSMVEASPDATFINRGNEIIYANPAALRLLGAARLEQIAGRSPLDFVHPDGRAAARQRVSLINAGDPIAGLHEQRFLRLDGSVVDAEISMSPVVFGGRLARQVVARDISARKTVEAALRNSEERYRLLVESLHDAVLIYEDDRVAYVNSTAVRMFGAEKAEQIVGRTIQQMIHPSGQAAALARREYVLKTGLPTGLFEQTYMRLDGSAIDVEGSSILIPGSPTRQRLIAMRDVSARKRAEAALRESEARLRMAVEAASMTNWEWDIASDQTHWGVGHENLLGPLPPDAVKYPDFRDMVHADDRERFLAAGRATVAQGVPYDIEFRFVRTDGVLRWMRHSGRALRDEQGEVEGIAGVMQDVTRRHDIERELALARQRREALMDSIPAPAWLKDRNGRFLAVNRAWCERFKFDAAFAVGRTNSEIFPPDVAVVRDREDQLVFETRQEQRTERMTRVDGLAGWFETIKTPVFDENGEINGLVGVSHDITARRQAETQLRASEERFRQFAESVDDVFWIMDVNPQRVLYVNQAFERVWGVPVADLLADAKLWYKSIHPDDQSANLAVFNMWLNDPVCDVYNEEYRIVRADGQVRWIRDRGTKLTDAAGKVYRVHGIAEDITAQRETERALVESQQRRDALLESNPDPSWLKDTDSRYIVANRAWFKRHGIERQPIAGLTDKVFFGAEREVLLREEDLQVMTTRTLIRRERKWLFADGTEWIETVKAPVFDGEGKVVAVVGISHDISALKRNEMAMQEMNVSLAEKTTALTALNRELESFAYTVSHDLRAPLRHIDGFINLLKVHAGPALDAQSTRYFDRVSHAARRMGLLIDDLLAFSRTGRAELRNQRVALDRLLRETIEHLAPDTAGRKIEWKIGALPEVEGDSGLLGIVFQNLVGNAVKYTRPRAVAHIEISEIAGDSSAVTVEVRDNGVGFDMTYQNKLFGVFQRLHTDAEFEGTGIGLATVARIVQRHGGRVWAQGATGEGARFYITLPRAQRPARVA
jgi:PAS domain S-box-containing protein